MKILHVVSDDKRESAPDACLVPGNSSGCRDGLKPAIPWRRRFGGDLRGQRSWRRVRSCQHCCRWRDRNRGWRTQEASVGTPTLYGCAFLCFWEAEAPLSRARRFRPSIALACIIGPIPSGSLNGVWARCARSDVAPPICGDGDAHVKRKCGTRNPNSAASLRFVQSSHTRVGNFWLGVCWMLNNLDLSGTTGLHRCRNCCR